MLSWDPCGNEKHSQVQKRTPLNTEELKESKTSSVEI